jgi:hypothetical protein
MSDPLTLRPAVRMTRIIELTEDMSDFYLTPDDDTVTGDGAVQNAQAHATSNRKDSRKGRRGGKSKKAKGKEKADELLAEEVRAEDTDDASSSTMSEGIINTEPLNEPYQPRKLPDLPAQNGTPTPYTYVPVLPYYEFRTISSADTVDSANSSLRIDKHGLFATQTLEAGTRIISEPPLIALPAPGDQIFQLMQAYHALPAHEQDSIWSLNPCDSSASEMLTYIAKHISDKMMLLAAIKSKSEDQRTKEEEDFLTDQLPRIAEATDVYRIAARWHAGRCSLTNLPEDQRDNLPVGTPITGLFVETAKLRHSCIPNCYAHYNASTNQMTVHVTGPIPAGTELTLSALSRNFYSSAADRALELQQKFGITCVCEACDPTHRVFSKHETARIAANGRALILLHFLTQLSILDSDQVLANLHLTPSHRDDTPDLDALRDAENTLLSLIADLKNTGCTGPELIRWYNALVDRIQPRLADELSDGERLTWWRFVCRHAREAEKVGVRGFGRDNEIVKNMGERAKRVEDLVTLCEEKMGKMGVKRVEERVRRNRK